MNKPEMFLNHEVHDGIGALIEYCHEISRYKGWYTDLETGEDLKRNVPEMLCLIHSEISEALEGYRKNTQDNHLPEYKSIEAELADALIRIFDLAGYLDLDLARAVLSKCEYNLMRKDHSIEERKKPDGKKF